MLSPIALDHITIIVADLDVTRQFYVDKLGMQAVERPAFDFPGLWFQAGDTQIHATLTSPESGRAGLGNLGSSIASRGHHFAFRVADCRAQAAQLADLGIEILQGPKERPDGAVQVYFADPDGHVIELVSG